MPLSDLIIADRSEAVAINQADGGPLQKWECLESKGIDPVKLGKLWAILSRSEFDPGFMGDDCLLHQDSDDGPWLMLVPSQLIAALAALDSERIESVAGEWAKTEEFQLPGWSEDVVIDYFRDLVVFVQKAQAQGKDLLLWMSL